MGKKVAAVRQGHLRNAWIKFQGNSHQRSKVQHVRMQTTRVVPAPALRMYITVPYLVRAVQETVNVESGALEKLCR